MKKSESHNKSVRVTKTNTKMLCPLCGHHDFKKKEGFSLFGQRFVCAKCNGTFSKANVVRVKSTNVHVNGGSKANSHGGKKSNHKHK